MHLHLPHLRFRIPVVAYRPRSHPHGEAITIRMSVADPQAVGIVPGMDGELEWDDGTTRQVRIGNTWRLLKQGAEVQMAVRTAKRLVRVAL